MKDLGASYVEDAQKAASESLGYAEASKDMSVVSESFAIGGTETRENEDEDNSKYYKEQCESYCHGATGKRENEDADNAYYYKNICESVSTQSKEILDDAKNILDDAQRRLGSVTIRLNPDTGYMEQTESPIYIFRYNEETGYLERMVE